VRTDAVIDVSVGLDVRDQVLAVGDLVAVEVLVLQ
jgi:hypothetical protein